MRRVRTAVFLVFVLLVLVGAAIPVGEAAGLSEAAAGIVGWAVGICSTYAVWRVVRARRRRRESAQVDRDRAAGGQLQRDDPRRYKTILAESSDPLAVLDPDLYVGRHFEPPLPEPSALAEPSGIEVEKSFRDELRRPPGRNRLVHAAFLLINAALFPFVVGLVLVPVLVPLYWGSELVQAIARGAGAEWGQGRSALVFAAPALLLITIVVLRHRRRASRLIQPDAGDERLA